MEHQTTTSVTIIGGSIVGLSAALFLAQQNVPFILVERHPGSSAHPRAIGWTHRTMELFRSSGVAEAMAALADDVASGPSGKKRTGKPRRVKAKTLSGEWSDESHWGGGGGKPGSSSGGPGKPGGGGGGGPPKMPDLSSLTPATDQALTQDKLETILREKIADILGENGRSSEECLRYGCRMTSWSQASDGGVTVHVSPMTEKENNKKNAATPFTISSRYIIACDGARSRIRDEDLAIKRSYGVGYMRTLRSILFRCPRIEKHRNREGYAGVSQWSIDDGAGLEVFLVTYSDGRWALMSNNEAHDGLDEAGQKALIRRVIGGGVEDHNDDDDIEIITHGRWDLTGLVADQFRKGPVFLAGDAAHALPPNRGGYGANTGIHDVHNLAWKLAAVVRGQANESLLDTYEAERRPVAVLRHDQIFVRDDYKGYVTGTKWAAERKKRERSEGTTTTTTVTTTAILDDVAMELGQLYRSKAVANEEKGEGGQKEGELLLLPPPVSSFDHHPEARSPAEWKGRAGTRAPHVMLVAAGIGGGGEGEEEGEEKKKTMSPLSSTLDLFGGDWIVLSEDVRWGQGISERCGSSCRFVQIGGLQVREEDDDEGGESTPGGKFRERFGLGPSGAALVRPDGYIAARWVEIPDSDAEAVLGAVFRQVAHVSSA